MLWLLVVLILIEPGLGSCGKDEKCCMADKSKCASPVGSCCKLSEVCCQLGSSPWAGAFTCCAQGSKCEPTDTKTELSGGSSRPKNMCTAPKQTRTEIRQITTANPPPYVPASTRQIVSNMATANVATANQCGTCCLGPGKCKGLTANRIPGSCCPTGASCCLSRGAIPAFGAYTCCPTASQTCTTDVKYSNTISTTAPGQCIARTGLLCRGFDVVTKATTTGTAKVELRCGLGQKPCPGISDFCDTTNYLPNDPLVGVCCRDVNSAVGCQQKTNCGDCTKANCFWNSDTGYCNNKCERSEIFTSETAHSGDCVTDEKRCGSGPTDTCARHCGEVTPNRFNKPPPASLLTQGLETPKVAGDNMSSKKPASTTSFPGAAAILGKPNVGVAGCDYASRNILLDNYRCTNANQYTLANPLITDLESCQAAALANPRCGAFFSNNGAGGCDCLADGEQCMKLRNLGTNVYSMICGGAKQPSDYPYSSITKPWENYVNPENGPYNDRPYDLTANSGGITNGRTTKPGRRLQQWNPFWWDPFQPSVRAPRGPLLFGPPVYRPLPQAGRPAPDAAWVVVSTSYLEETLQYEAKGGDARTCSCDPLCNQYGDCCSDYEQVCLDVTGGQGTGY